MNFFSGHNMANEIMGKTSLPMQMREYQKDYSIGRVRTEEFLPDRLNIAYEATKPFLPVPKPTLVVPIVNVESFLSRSIHSTEAPVFDTGKPSQNAFDEFAKGMYNRFKKQVKGEHNANLRALGYTVYDQ